MSFLSFAFLFALPLAAAPILLHLFDRQRNVIVEWGAMQFLVEAARRRTNARRLQQWLLLLLRSLAIFCLVAALARPLVSSHWMGTVERRDTILIVDNSLSMMRISQGGSLYDAALHTAVGYLNQLPAGDTVRVLWTSPYPIWMTPASVTINGDSRSALIEQMENQQPTLGRSDLLAGLFNAVQAEASPGTKHRRILVISDGQAADWKIADDHGWQKLREILQSATVPTELQMVTLESTGPVSNTDPDDGPRQRVPLNMAVNTIRSNRTISGPQQLVSFSAQVQNHGITPSDPCTLTWTVAGEEQDRSQIPSLQPNEVHDIVWKHAFPTLGVFSVSGEIDADDVLRPDNRESVIVEVVDKVPVLIVENAAGADEIQQDAFFIQAALGWIDGESLETQGVHVPTLVSADQLERTGLNGFRVVVIPNYEDLSETVVRKLHDFASEGGGIWIALGARTDIERFNQFLHADGDGLSPLAIDRIVDESKSDGPRTTIDPFTTGHPAAGGLADNLRLDTGKIVVSRRFRFTTSSAGESTTALLNLTTGDPLAVERLVGRGRIIVQAVPLKLQWSELVRSQAFVVMVQDWLNYLAQPQAMRHNLAPGDPLILHMAGSDITEATLRTPQREDVELTADVDAHGVVFRSSRTIHPGDYSLEVGLSGDKIPFHVSRDPLESNLTPLTEKESQRLAGIAQVGHSAMRDDTESLVPANPVWPLLLMSLIGLMVVELLLSGSMSRQRFGNDPIAESIEHLSVDTPAASEHLRPTRRSFGEENARTSSRV